MLHGSNIKNDVCRWERCRESFDFVANRIIEHSPNRLVFCRIASSSFISIFFFGQPKWTQSPDTFVFWDLLLGLLIVFPSSEISLARPRHMSGGRQVRYGLAGSIDKESLVHQIGQGLVDLVVRIASESNAAIQN